MKRTVTVLQDDIDQGVQGNAGSCPVARAARRDLADLLVSCFMPVSVGPTVLRLNDHRDKIPVPGAVTDFIYSFDNGLPVEPFKFEIEVPPEDLGNPRG